MLTLALALVFAADPDPKGLIVAPADRTHAAGLVRQLAHPDFLVRDKAHTELAKMGRLALPVLLKAVDEEPDPELRYRCELLLPAAATADFDARLATFLADDDGKYTHDFPAWDAFRKATAADPLARSLFAELMKTPENRHLIAGLALGDGELTRRILDRRIDLYEKMYPSSRADIARLDRYEPTVLDLAALAFCETLAGDKSTPRGAFRMATPYTLLIRSGLRSQLATDHYATAATKLVVGWLDTRDNATSLGQAVTVASQLSLPNAVKYSVKMLRVPGTTAYQRATAATTVARLGTKDDLSVLAELLADEAVVRQPVGGAGEVQVRDVALAMAIVLSGRDPTAFGMHSGSIDDSPRYYYWHYSFPTAEARAAGMAKWLEVEPKLGPPKK